MPAHPGQDGVYGWCNVLHCILTQHCARSVHLFLSHRYLYFPIHIFTHTYIYIYLSASYHPVIASLCNSPPSPPNDYHDSKPVNSSDLFSETPSFSLLCLLTLSLHFFIFHSLNQFFLSFSLSFGNAFFICCVYAVGNGGNCLHIEYVVQLYI